MDAFNGERLINIALSGDLRQFTEHITKNQVKINYQNSRGETALHTALRMGRFNIIRPLLDKGAKLEIPDYSGATPLHYAVNYGHEDLVWQLLEKIGMFNNQIIDMQNEAGETALHLACSQQNVNIVRLLLQYGASRDILTKDGATPAHLAIGQEDILALLLNESKKVINGETGGEEANQSQETGVGASVAVAPETADGTDESHAQNKLLLAQALKHGSKEWRRSKLSFVGEGRAGKSALANAVVGRPFEETASTVGINQLTCDVRQVKATAGGASGASPTQQEQQWGECSSAERELETAIAQIVAAQRKQQQVAQIAASDEPATVPTPATENIVSLMQAQRAQQAIQHDEDDHAQKARDIHAADTDAPGTIQADNHATTTVEEAEAKENTSLNTQELDEEMVMKTLATLTDDELGLLISLFDFGGQSVFDVIHHLFLTRNGVYALVFNMEWLVTDGPEKEKALRFMRNWLSSIVVHTFDASTGSAAPIVFVGTRLDTVSSGAAHERISTCLYENFSDNLAWRSVLENENGHDSNGKAFQWFFPVDNTAGKTGSALSNLMAVIHRAIDRAAYTHKEVPLAWFRVMDRMKDVNRDCLQLNEVQEIAAQCSVSALEVPLLLSFLHDMGHLMWHDEPELRDVVILDPVSYLVAPATIIICKLTPDHDDSTHHFMAMHRECDRLHKREWLLLKQEGVLSSVLLPILWKDYASHTNSLLLLMVKFGLLVPLRGGTTSNTTSSGAITQYLVPTLLAPASVANLAVVQWTESPTVLSTYLVFTLVEDLENTSTISQIDLKSSGFLPGGMFERLVGKALSWSQSTSKQAGLNLHNVLMHKDVAVLSFGRQRFRLVNCAEIHAIRVDVEGSNPIGVLQKLLGFVKKIIDECMKCLRCLAAVSYTSDSFHSTSPEVIQQKALHPSELLIPLKQLRQASKGESMLAWRGGRALMTPHELRSRYNPWLQLYHLREHYDVFISYRWGTHDSDFTEALFDMLTNFSVGESNRAVEVFLDRKRLQEGRRFKSDFAAALTHSLIALPVVSSCALTRMIDHSPEAVDNVLLEWVIILECAAAKRLLKVYPVLFGTRVQKQHLAQTADSEPSQPEVLTETMLRGGVEVGDFFAESIKDHLPHTVPSATLAQAAQLLQENGVTMSTSFATYTVHSIVHELLQFLLCNAAAVESSVLVETCAEKLIILLTDCGTELLSKVVPAASPISVATVPHAISTPVKCTAIPISPAVHASVDAGHAPATTVGAENRPLKSLSAAEVCQLLEHEQLGAISELLLQRKVSGVMLYYVEDIADLLSADYGLTSKGLARGLFEMITEWKANGVPSF